MAAVERAEATVPDVVLVDVECALVGSRRARPSASGCPSARIVMLTMSDGESDLFEAVRAGANGYVLSDRPGARIVAGIRAVHAGDSSIFSMASSEPAPSSSPRCADWTSRWSAAYSPKLTERERSRCSARVARGLGNREIGRELFISENTVKNHVRNILEKLQLHTRSW